MGKAAETRLLVSTVIEYIPGNVSTNPVIHVDERGMPHMIVGRLLYVILVVLKATLELIVRVSTVPPLLTKGKERVLPKTTPECLSCRRRSS
jgi:hypothetical protein